MLEPVAETNVGLSAMFEPVPVVAATPLIPRMTALLIRDVTTPLFCATNCGTENGMMA
jgi:hypothetical protein